MIDCGLYYGQNLYSIAFHYLNLLVCWTGINEHIDILYLILKSTSYEYILEKILLTSEVGQIIIIIYPQVLSSEPSPFLPDGVILSCNY
jgi:hypothetical protein